MRLPVPFVKLPLSFDHATLADEIRRFEEGDWRGHPQRFEGNHSLVLVSSNGGENDDFQGPMKPTDRLKSTPYIRQIMAEFNTVIGRSRLMRLAPGASVAEHTDAHYFWRNHLRIHIPIITDPAVAFYCDSEMVHMAAGESWTFDNWRLHSVENRSDKTRIHLVIDTVGSADLWRMIDGSDGIPRHVKFAANAEPELRFENFPGLPVLPGTELRADLEQLVEDIEAFDAHESQLKEQLRSLTSDFIHDWQSHWMVHGLAIDGLPGFENLLESYRQKVDQVPDRLLLASNNYSFKRAVKYTLDAALVPENVIKSEKGVSASGPAPVHGTRPQFDRPVIIVAAPRSGSTLLFETLAVNRELWSVGDESHKHFESIASLRPNTKNPSNRLTAAMATPEVVDTLMNFFVADLVNGDGQSFTYLPRRSRPQKIRFLEKTPKNALRIPFLIEMFPDARFIFLFREARQNISSLLDSWRSRQFVTYPQLPQWPADKPWSHLLIPGWQELADSPLAEIAARQWLVTNRTILEDLDNVPRERWCAVEYDTLLANTPAELNRLCDFSQLIFGPRMQQLASSPLKPSKYTLTAPHPDKWKKNAEEIEPVLPSTRELMAALRALA